MNYRRALIALLMVLLLLPVIMTSCTSAPSNEIIVLAAGGSKPALDEICQEYNRLHNAKVVVSYGSGAEMLYYMRWGNCGDVYVAPEQSFMDIAEEEGLIDSETRTSIAYMIPAIAVAKGNPNNIQALSGLAKEGVRVALTRPETTLLGVLAPEIFEKAGLSQEIGNNIVAYASDPNSLIQLIIGGGVDAGITWHFYQDYSPDKLEIIFLSPDEITRIGELQAAVITYSSNGPEAREFLDFLVSETSQYIFKNHGYITNKEEVKRYWR